MQMFFGISESANGGGGRVGETPPISGTSVSGLAADSFSEDEPLDEDSLDEDVSDEESFSDDSLDEDFFEEDSFEDASFEDDSFDDVCEDDEAPLAVGSLGAAAMANDNQLAQTTAVIITAIIFFIDIGFPTPPWQINVFASVMQKSQELEKIIHMTATFIAVSGKIC